MGKGANSMAVSGLVFRSDLVGTGRAISVPFGINGVRNERSHLVGPPFLEFKGPFFSYLWQVGISLETTRHLLIGGCGQGHRSVE